VIPSSFEAFGLGDFLLTPHGINPGKEAAEGIM
jgi:hypothetical protein